MSVYRINDWDEHFENSRSREIPHPAFVYMPNKQHGLGFQRLTRLPGVEGAAAFGLWVFLLQACSRQDGSAHGNRSGWLTDDGTATGVPWDADDMAMRWGMPVEFVAKVLDLLCSPRVGWMRLYDAAPQGVADDRQLSGSCPAPDRQLSGSCPAPDRQLSGSCPAPDRQLGAGQLPTEQNRTELNWTVVVERAGAGDEAQPPQPSEQTAPPPPPTNPPGDGKHGTAELLAEFGLPNSPRDASEWAGGINKTARCRSLDEARHFLRWAMGHRKKQDRPCDHWRHVRELAIEWDHNNHREKVSA